MTEGVVADVTAAAAVAEVVGTAVEVRAVAAAAVVVVGSHCEREERRAQHLQLKITTLKDQHAVTMTKKKNVRTEGMVALRLRTACTPICIVRKSDESVCECV